jgi:teichuronic acid exporter
VNLRDQVLHGLRWTAGARFGGQLVTWAITIVVMRLLSPADYGLLNMAAAFVGLFALFSEFGLASAIVREREIDEATLRKVLGFVIVVHGALAGLLAATSPLVARFFGERRLVPVTCALALQFPLSAFMVVPDALLERRMQFKKRSLLSLSASLANSFVTLGLAWSGAGVWALVWGNLVGVAWLTLATNSFSRAPLLPSFSFSGASRFLAFGGRITLGRLLYFAHSQADSFIGGKLLGATPLGYYAVAKHLGTLTVQRASAILNQVSYPAFASIQDRPDLVAYNFLKAVRLLCFVTMPVQWGIAAVAPEVVAVFLGDRWTAVGVPLAILAMAVPLQFVQLMLGSPLQAVGRPDVTVRMQLVNCVCYPAALLLGVRWGVVGFSGGIASAVVVTFLWNLRQALPVLGVRPRDVMAALARPAFASLSMFAAVCAIRSVLGLGAGARLALLTASGAAVYIGVTFAIDRRGVRELLQLVRGR